MIRAEKLLDIGLRCPCGGRVYHRYELNGWEESLHCTDCVDIRYGYRIGGWTTEKKIAMLTDWLVLTGGPIPGEIKPPEHVDIWMEFGGDIVSEAGEYLARAYIPHWDGGTGAILSTPEQWWFLDRNPEGIRPWLEEEEI